MVSVSVSVSNMVPSGRLNPFEEKRGAAAEMSGRALQKKGNQVEVDMEVPALPTLKSPHIVGRRGKTAKGLCEIESSCCDWRERVGRASNRS